MIKKSCLIYDSWADQIVNLPDEMAGQYIKGILQYAIYGEDVRFENPALQAMFISVKRRLDEDNEKYQAKVERAKRNSIRNRTEVDTISDRNRDEVKGVNVNDNVNVNVNDKNNNKAKNIHNFPERSYDYEALMKGTKHGNE